ncbi:MAG: aminopeptidase P family protein [Ruminococcaceae bacterium]|nr:aminopeptidase P family protein [Oscillospiraceae bacterium]
MSLESFSRSLSAGECALILSRVSRQFLTGFRSSDGVLLVTREKSFLFLDSRYFEMAQIDEGRGRLSAGLELHPNVFHEFFSDFLQSRAIKTVYFEDREMTVSSLARLKERYPSAEYAPLTDRIEKMRQVKGEGEIKKLRAAQSLAEAAFAYILPRIEAGRTELAVAAELEYFMKQGGASGPSFDTICVSGTRSSLPHGTPTDAPLEKNTFITMDFGCMLDGYASDMTRTVCLGKADEEMKKVYGTVLSAQLSALSAIRAGVTGKEADRAARDVIASAGYGDFFGHSTGHGIGLQVHEAPSFSPSYEGVIPAGAVMSVEPGIYLPGKFGVRIEDLVVVRENGFENLNTSSKLLLEL